MLQKLAAEGEAAFSEYETGGRPEVLEAAVTAFRLAVDAIPPGHPARAGFLSNLGICLYRRFECAGDRADLDDAIGFCEQAAEAAGPGHPDRARYLSNLGNCLCTRFAYTGDGADLDAAIEFGRQVADAAEPGHPARAGRLSNLGVLMLTRYEHGGDRADLDAAIDFGQQAARAAEPGDPQRARYLSNLGNSLRIRFDHTADRADLDAAVDLGRQAAGAATPGHPERGTYLLNLAAALFRRFENGGDRADLDAAIDVGQQAADAAPSGHPERATRLSNLGNYLRRRFEVDGDRADLDAAIEFGRQAADAAVQGRPDHARFLSNLAASLLRRFEIADDRVDLDAAIDAGRQAADAAVRGRPDRAGYLSNLAASLLRRFDALGERADLDAAVDQGWQAVDATALDDPDLPGYLSNLANSLRIRFEDAGDPSDLDAAIDLGHQAAAAAPPGHPSTAMYLANLAGSLHRRFEVAGDRADLDAAVDLGRQAARAVPPGHHNRAMYLSNLANSLRTRFDETGDRADLDAAIDLGRQAARTVRPGHPARVMYLSSLGGSLHRRFEVAGDRADLEAAIELARQAVDDTPPGNPARAVYLRNLGRSVYARFQADGDHADLTAAINSWKHSSQVPAGPPRVRLTAARGWGTAAAAAGIPHDAADGYATAVGLMPQVAWHGLGRAVRQRQVEEWAGLAPDAAAAAVIAGRPDAAVELLEQGRSLLWTQALMLRGDLSRLAAIAPDLAGRLDSIRAALASPVPEMTPPVPDREDAAAEVALTRWQRETAEARKRRAREWDKIMAQVHALDGFEHFLSRTPYPQLATAADRGPVVILNASRYGCHALIVEAGMPHPRVISLPLVTLSTATQHASSMLDALRSATETTRSLRDRDTDRRAVLGILDWLWDAIAEPVLGALGHTAPPAAGKPWPRVWWCPTGPLTLLPIHAAGKHSRYPDISAAEPDWVLGRVVSSYTPTLAALGRASRPGQHAHPRHLTIALPETPGQPPLPAVHDELTVLGRHFPPGQSSQQLAGHHATRNTVLAALATCSWVHFACHAVQHNADPDRSGFALWDSPLTIADLAGQAVQSHDLAFLSACQTAAGSTRHLDEAIHLAAAMQFLGYRHVIATMWTAADPPAPEVANAVYTKLTEDGPSQQGRAAEALHQAVRSLRRNYPANPLVWAPYIHLGP